MPQLEEELRRFVIESFLLGVPEEAPADTDSLTALGVMDATGVTDLTRFLERCYGLIVPAIDVVPANLDSIARIAAYVRRRQRASSPAPARSTVTGLPSAPGGTASEHHVKGVVADGADG